MATMSADCSMHQVCQPDIASDEMLPASLRPLSSRNYALVWSAALVSNVGTWMQIVALGVVVTAKTHEPGWTGLVAAAGFLPNGLLAPLGGALADRLDRRRWLIVTTLAEAAFAAGLAALAFTGHDVPWVLTVVAFLGGTASAIGFPTYQAMLPDLVERKDLLAAVSLSSAQFNLGRVIGPALAGIALVAGSAGWAFTANAISFGAVVVALLLVRLPTQVRSIGSGIVHRLREGARIAAELPGCRSPIVLIAVVALIGSPFIALVPAVAIEEFHKGAGGTSVLVTAQGIGAVAGALMLSWVARTVGRARMVTSALFALPVALLLYGVAPSFDLAVVALLVVGACYIGVLSGLNTVVQVHAPPEARGRVLGLYMLALGTIYPLGALAQGQLADLEGIKAVTIGSGVVLAVTMGVLALLAPGLFGGLEDPATDEPGHGLKGPGLVVAADADGEGTGAAVPSGA
jgi:MFS family permease